MLLFENSFRSTYEEIKTWNPVWYRKVHDMDALWQVFGGQLDKIQGDLIQLVNNNFVDFADEITIIRLEEFLSIKHLFPRTLVERRNIIKGFIIGQGHIGRQRIIELVSIFTNGEINVTFSNGVITIYVTKDFEDVFNLSDINLILGDRIPAHLALGIVDLPRPVKVVNKNNLSFIDLCMMRFGIRNRTSIVIGSRLNGERLLKGSWLLTVTKHGIIFKDFHFKGKLKNYRKIIFNQGLNGITQLDGLFILNGGVQRVLSGIESRKMELTGFKFYTYNKIKSHINYQIKLKSTQDFIINNFCVHGRLQELLIELSVQQINMGTYTLKNKSQLSASLIRKGRWYMDGEFTLNGINTINKYIIKEAI